MPTPSGEDSLKIAEMYRGGESSTIIAKALGFSVPTVLKHVVLNGIDKRRRTVSRYYPRVKTITLEQRRELLERLAAGETQASIAKSFGVTHSAITPHLRRAGIPPRTSRRHMLDETVFDEVSPLSAYWAGFLMADGTIRANDHYFAVHLAWHDRHHILAFKRFLKSSHKIGVNPRRGTRQAAVGMCIFSKPICAALGRFGVIPRKTINVEVIDLDENRDFWRGMIDGDGSLGMYDDAYGMVPRLSLCGTKRIIEQFRDYCETVIGPLNASPSQKGVIWVLSIGGQQAVQLIRHFYQRDDFAMRRKYELARDIVQWFA